MIKSAEVTETTVLEVLSCTATAHSSWIRFRDSTQLAKQGLSAANLNTHELAYVEGLYSGRWGGSHNAYRATRMFFKATPKIVFTDEAI